MWYGTSRNFLPVIQSLCLRDDRGEFRNAACRRVALEDQVQHGHEMALAAAEAAVQVARLARLRLQGALDEAQGVFVSKPSAQGSPHTRGASPRDG